LVECILDYTFLLNGISEVYVVNCSEPQENYLIVSEDDMKRKFQEFMKEKKEIDSQIIRERMIVHNNPLEPKEQVINTRKTKSDWLNELESPKSNDIKFNQKISMEKQLKVRVFIEHAENLDHNEANNEEEIIEKKRIILKILM
jgi:hypothetical protein